MPRGVVHSELIVPGFVGVEANGSPWPKVSDLIGPPMTLCGALSSLVHVTFWPTFTVAAFGENWMFFMVIWTVSLLAVPPPPVFWGAGVGFFAADDELSSPPQP